MSTIISSSGTKGLLQWLKATQPDFYAYLSPQLIALAKKKTMGCMPPMRLHGLGDAYTNYANYVTAPDITVGPVDAGENPGFSDLTIAPQTTDAVSASSSTPTSANLAQAIGAIAQGYSSATLTAAQVSANNTLLQTNLQRAQQGLPPLTMAAASSGFTSLTSNSGLLLLGLAAAVALAMGSKKSV